MVCSRTRKREGWKCSRNSRLGEFPIISMLSNFDATDGLTAVAGGSRGVLESFQIWKMCLQNCQTNLTVHAVLSGSLQAAEQQRFSQERKLPQRCQGGRDSSGDPSAGHPANTGMSCTPEQAVGLTESPTQSAKTAQKEVCLRSKFRPQHCTHSCDSQ